MSLSALAEAIEISAPEMISTDLFDTVLLRDHTIESDRFAMACRRAAPQIGAHPAVLTTLRRSFHDTAYRAVAMERPQGEAALSAICRAIATAYGLDATAAQILHRTEVDVDIEHLAPNRPLLDLLGRARRRGIRVVAVSDTYYSELDLRRILDAVVGPHPFSAVYSSADVGLTKHAGCIFDEVVKREGVVAEKIVHVGDNHGADVQMARAARWTAVHLPRANRHRAAKLAGKAMSLALRIRSSG